MESPSLHVGDCLDVLASGAVDAGSVSLICTSPPYAQQRASSYGGVDPDEYVDWFMLRAEQFRQVLAPDGSLVLNLKAHRENGGRHPYVMRLLLAMHDVGWRLVDEYIWRKTNPFPARWAEHVSDAYEPLYHLAPSARRVKFRPPPSRHNRHGDVHPAQMSIPMDIAPVPRREYVTIGGFRTVAGLRNGLGVSISNVIDAAAGGAHTEHPAAFPMAVPGFFIELMTDAGDLVMDPFAGSGATLVAALYAGRRAVGIEIHPHYVTSTWRRMEYEFGAWVRPSHSRAASSSPAP